MGIQQLKINCLNSVDENGRKVDGRPELTEETRRGAQSVRKKDGTRAQCTRTAQANARERGKFRPPRT